MLLNILAVALILAIAFYQSLQGAYGAVIMAFLTVAAAVAAFGYYEPLGDALVERLGAYAHPAAMLAIFFILLFALREVFDRAFKHNVVLPVWPDRIAGGACGLLTGTLLTGMLAVIVQLLPLPGSFLGYEPYTPGLAAAGGGAAGFAGNFAVGLAEKLSAGSLSPITGGGNFRTVHDDLLLEAFCQRSRPDGGRADAPPGVLRVTESYVIAPAPKGKPPSTYSSDEATRERILKDAPAYPPLPPLEQENTDVLVIRALVNDSARNERDNWFRLPATHFRLVTRSAASFYPIGYLTHCGQWRLCTAKDKKNPELTGVVVQRPWDKQKGPRTLQVDWVYRLPANERPDYMVFRRSAKAAVPPFDPNAWLPKREGALSVLPVLQKTEFMPPEAGAVFQPVIMEATAALPTGIMIQNLPPDERPAPTRGATLETVNLVKGVIVGSVDDVTARKRAEGINNVNSFAIPSDKQVLVQVQFKMDDKAPVAAQVRDQLEKMTPRLEFNDGQTLPHIGAYVIYTAQTDKKDQVHLYYDPAGKFDKPDPQFLKDLLGNAAAVKTFGLVFAVPIDPDRNIVALRLNVGPAHDFITKSPLAFSK